MSEATDRRRAFGRAGTGAGWTAGVRDRTRSNGVMADHIVARLDDPTPEEVREMIADQCCWWCGRGPFRSVVAHTRWAHHIMAADIRRLGGLIQKVPLVSDALRDDMSRRPQTVGMDRAKMDAGRHGGYRMSEVGHERALERNRLQYERDPEARHAQLARANEKMRAKMTQPHYCTAGCGTLLPKANPRTCSPECRKIVRQQTARAVQAAKAAPALIAVRSDLKESDDPEHDLDGPDPFGF